MSDNPSRKLLEQSVGWIKDHWDAKNLDVPPEFIRKWIYESNDEELKPSGFYLCVFTFGYCHHQLVSNDVPLGKQVSVSSTRIVELFHVWQLKLAMAEIHRVTDVRVRPMPLFDFPDGEKIEYWRVPWEKATGS
jgi:hypothetical protein